MGSKADMAGASRRRFLEVAGAGAIAGLVALARPHHLAARDVRAITPPTGRRILTRGLERTLFDGKQIIVRRKWAIDFVPETNGWTVAGELIGVEVDVPPPLAPLANIEKNRPVSESFPIRLDGEGLILYGQGRASKLDMDQVASAASEVIASAGTFAIDQRAARMFVGQLDQAANSLMSLFPQDLFFPSTEPVTDRRTMDLANGLVGEMEMRYTATADGGTGLLRTSRRLVTTRIGGESMESAELWELA